MKINLKYFQLPTYEQIINVRNIEKDNINSVAWFADILNISPKYCGIY